MNRLATYTLTLLTCAAGGIAWTQLEDEPTDAPAAAASAESGEQPQAAPAPQPERSVAPDTSLSEEERRAAWQAEAQQLQNDLMQALLQGDKDAIEMAQQRARQIANQFAKPGPR